MKLEQASAAISLWQPWASAIAVGSKRVETRSKGTGYRGTIAIHAAKRWNHDLADTALDMIRLGVPLPSPKEARGGRRLERWLPLGQVVCVARLTECRLMTQALVEDQTDLERALGGWGPGRWAWQLEEVTPLGEPYALKGHQWLWGLSASDVDAINERLG